MSLLMTKRQLLNTVLAIGSLDEVFIAWMLGCYPNNENNHLM